MEVGASNTSRQPPALHAHVSKYVSTPSRLSFLVTFLLHAHERTTKKELMGSLVFSGNLETSPYSHLLSSSLWARAKESVAVDGSRVSGLSRESILSVAFRVRDGA